MNGNGAPSPDRDLPMGDPAFEPAASFEPTGLMDGNETEFDLCPQDASALEALAAAGWDVSATPVVHAERAARCAGLLACVAGGEVAFDQALEDVTLVRVARARASGRGVTAVAGVNASLSEADITTVDAVLGGEGEPADAERLRRCQTLLALLDTPLGGMPASQTETLINATLATVDRAIRSEEASLTLGAHEASSPWRFNVADLGAVAALLLIGSAVAWPVLDGLRHHAGRMSCQSNMAMAGLAFGAYSASNRDMLPVATASPAGNPWWEVGSTPERSNSANLYTLVRTGYAAVTDLACTGNRSACIKAEPSAMDWSKFRDVSFSYQIMFGRVDGGGTAITSPTMVLIADRSPMEIVGRNQLRIFPMANSANHRREGQNTLLADGSVQWLTSPVRSNGDNIWLPRHVEQAIEPFLRPTDASTIRGTETSAGAEDTFVGP